MTRTQRVWRGGKRASGFALAPMLGAATPLLALPAIAHMFGAQGWADIAVGQSAGAGAAVIVELGWALTGPQRVASAGPPERSRMFVVAFWSKMATYVAVAPFAAALCWKLVDVHEVAAVLATLATAATGLSANWYFIGEGRPARVIMSDAVPKLLFTLFAAIGILTGMALWFFSLLVLVGGMVSIALAWFIVVRDSGWSRQIPTIGMVIVAIREQLVALSGRVASALYIGLSVAVVQAFAPTAVPAFAAVDRLLRMGLLVLQGVSHALQRYVGVAAAGRVLHVRIKQVLTVQTLVGVVAALFVWLCLPTAVWLLLRGTVEVDRQTAALASVVVLLTCVSRGTGLVLVALDDIPWITASAFAGATVAAVALPTMATAWGSNGAILAVISAEACVALIQITKVIVALRTAAPTETPDPEDIRQSASVLQDLPLT